MQLYHAVVGLVWYLEMVRVDALGKHTGAMLQAPPQQHLSGGLA